MKIMNFLLSAYDSQFYLLNKFKIENGKVLFSDDERVDTASILADEAIKEGIALEINASANHLLLIMEQLADNIGKGSSVDKRVLTDLEIRTHTLLQNVEVFVKPPVGETAFDGALVKYVDLEDVNTSCLLLDDQRMEVTKKKVESALASFKQKVKEAAMEKISVAFTNGTVEIDKKTSPFLAAMSSGIFVQEDSKGARAPIVLNMTLEQFNRIETILKTGQLTEVPTKVLINDFLVADQLGMNRACLVIVRELLKSSSAIEELFNESPAIAITLGSVFAAMNRNLAIALMKGFPDLIKEVKEEKNKDQLQRIYIDNINNFRISLPEIGILEALNLIKEMHPEVKARFEFFDPCEEVDWRKRLDWNHAELCLEVLSGCPNIKSLIIQCGQVDHDFLNKVKAMNLQLFELVLTDCSNISNDDLVAFIVAHPNVISLNLANTNFNDMSLKIIAAHLKDLRYLNISRNSSISTSGLQSLIDLGLEGLNFIIDHQNEDNLIQIGKIKSLKRLAIGGEIIDDWLKHLNELQLNDLELVGNTHLTDNGLVHFIGMPLRRLSLHQHVSDNGLKNLASELEYLYVSQVRGGDSLTDEVFKYLGKNIKELKIFGGGKITDEGIHHLCNKPIQHLTLTSSRITRSAIPLFSQMPLRYLKLIRSSIRPEDLKNTELQKTCHVVLM